MATPLGLVVMELLPYTAEHLWLTEALETDERVMAELGGPWPRDAVAAIHERRLRSIAAGTWCFTIVPEQGQPPVGMIGIFGSDLDGSPISEAGWSILPAHQGRGYASSALRILLDRAQADGRWGPIHAFPGVTNDPSNALCRKSGFSMVGERTMDYGGRALHCNHWILEPSATRP
jgi:RimJ/RimL family protein N-acetyltransferase